MRHRKPLGCAVGQAWSSLKHVYRCCSAGRRGNSQFPRDSRLLHTPHLRTLGSFRRTFRSIHTTTGIQVPPGFEKHCISYPQRLGTRRVHVWRISLLPAHLLLMEVRAVQHLISILHPILRHRMRMLESVQQGSAAMQWLGTCASAIPGLGFMLGSK